MSIIEWIKKQTSPEAKLMRLEREVQKKELEAKLARDELPLLIRKDQAASIINKRNAVKQGIRDKKTAAAKERLKKLDKTFNFSPPKLKTLSQRVYKT